MARHEMSFVAVGLPVPAQRPRENFATPRKTMLYEDLVAKSFEYAVKPLHFQKGMDSQTVPMGFRVGIQFFFPIPKSWSRKKRQLARDREFACLSHSNGDVDNLAKSILDGISKSRYCPWYDDCMVVLDPIDKWYDDDPSAVVTISWEEVE